MKQNIKLKYQKFVTTFNAIKYYYKENIFYLEQDKKERFILNVIFEIARKNHDVKTMKIIEKIYKKYPLGKKRKAVSLIHLFNKKLGTDNIFTHPYDQMSIIFRLKLKIMEDLIDEMTPLAEDDEDKGILDNVRKLLKDIFVNNFEIQTPNGKPYFRENDEEFKNYQNQAEHELDHHINKWMDHFREYMNGYKRKAYEIDQDASMIIWRLKVDFQDYESLQFENREKSFMDEFHDIIKKSKPLKGYYDHTKVKVMDGVTQTDFPKLWDETSIPVISRKAKDVLYDLIKEEVEFIPLVCDNREFYLVNIINVVDAVDYDKATLKKLTSGLVIGLEEYHFKKEPLEGVNIFKFLLNDHIQTTEVFVSTAFKESVEESNLKGFKFIEVWNDTY